MERFVMAKDIAELVGMTYRRLKQIDDKLPPDRKLFEKDAVSGLFDLQVFIGRWVDYNVSLEATGNLNLDEVKAEHELVKKRKTELEVARLEGELVSADDVRRLWGDVAGAVRQALIQLPGVLAPMVLGIDSRETVTGIIDGEIRKALQMISETPLPGWAVKRDAEVADVVDVLQEAAR